MQIICLGDSITDCNHLFEDFPLGNGYVKILSELFRNQASPCSEPLHNPYNDCLSDTVLSGNVSPDTVLSHTVQFKNYGIDGFTVSRVLENIKQNRISLHCSPVVTLLIGINDIGLMMNTDRTDTQKEQMMQDFAMHYEELLKLLTTSASQVILMEPFIFPHPEEYQNWIPYVRTMSGHIRQLADKFQRPFLPLQGYFNNEAIQQGFDRITTDGIHLTQYGHRLLANRLFPLIHAF